MKLAANCVTKTTISSPFLLLSNTVHEIREKLFPRLKSEIQIRDFLLAKPEKPKICEIKLPRKISRHTGTSLNEFIFCAIWVRLYPDFNNHAFRNCVNFSGKKVAVPFSLQNGLLETSERFNKLHCNNAN